MSRKHLVFGIDVEEDTGGSCEKGVNSTASATAPIELGSNFDNEAACASIEDQMTDASNFGVPSRSRGRPGDEIATSSEEAWRPTLPTSAGSDDTPTEQIPASLLELLRSTDRTLIAILVFVGAMLVLLVLNQSIAFIDHLAQSPAWVQWVGLSALVCALGAIIGSLWSLATRYLRLKQTPALWLNRQQLRELAHTGTTDAKHRLETFLREFPIDRDPPQKWKRLGFTTESLQSLADARAELLNPCHGHTRKWLDELNDCFLARLDSVAQQRVAHYAKRVGIKTALSPKGFLDSIIVVVNSYLLLTDLCDLYNVRAGRMGTLRLLTRIGFNTVIAGNLDQPAEMLEQELRDSVQDWTATFAAQVLGKVVANAAEGGTNALLIYRLGKAATRELRPLRLN